MPVERRSMSSRWVLALASVASLMAALDTLIVTTALAFALVSAAFPPERRGSALGIFFAVTGLGVASGPLVGGAVTEGLAWQWIFWLNVPIGALLAPLALARLPESFGP